jgi:hypothetical protein
VGHAAGPTIQAHLKAQDDAMDAILERLEKLEAGLTKL